MSVSPSNHMSERTRMKSPKREKSPLDEYSSKTLRRYEENSNRENKTEVTRDRNKKKRHSSSTSPNLQKRNTLTSSIGAVISHESDGEYNAERMLKKSVVASQVS